MVAALAIFNLTAGLGFAVPLAKRFGRLTATDRYKRYFVMLVGIYFIECVAFSAGMATQVFSIALAFLWGIIFGLWLRHKTAARRILKQMFLFSIYATMPTASFCILIPLAWLVGGGNILSAQEGVNFGIPEFLPWPLTSILGFCMTLMIGTLIFKAVVATGEVGLLIHLKEKTASNSCKRAD